MSLYMYTFDCWLCFASIIYSLSSCRQLYLYLQVPAGLSRQCQPLIRPASLAKGELHFLQFSKYRLDDRQGFLAAPSEELLLLHNKDRRRTHWRHLIFVCHLLHIRRQKFYWDNTRGPKLGPGKTCGVGRKCRRRLFRRVSGAARLPKNSPRRPSWCTPDWA